MYVKGPFPECPFRVLTDVCNSVQAIFFCSIKSQQSAAVLSDMICSRSKEKNFYGEVDQANNRAGTSASGTVADESAESDLLHFPNFLVAILAISHVYFPDPTQQPSSKLRLLLLGKLYKGIVRVERHRRAVVNGLEQVDLLDIFESTPEIDSIVPREQDSDDEYDPAHRLDDSFDGSDFAIMQREHAKSEFFDSVTR